MIENRKNRILQAIVKHFVETAHPVGSHTILISYKFDVSPATIRNDMAALEHEGMIYQPHTSAGRIPTSRGYREFVDNMEDLEAARREARLTLSRLREGYALEKAREKIYDAVHLLSRATQNVGFATVPNRRTIYLGLSNVLKQPEFHDTMTASQIVEILENDDRFLNMLNQLKIAGTPKIFIGEEDLFDQIKSCSMIVTRYNCEGFDGYLGVLGPTRMRYPYNLAMVEEIQQLVNSEI